MVDTNASTTANFHKRCIDAISRWEQGLIPYAEAMTLLADLRKEAIDSGMVEHHARAEQFMGYIQHYRGSINLSTQHYERARTLYKQAGNLERMAVVDVNQGENYRLRGDFKHALQLYRGALEIAEKLGHVKLQTICAINEGMTLIELNNYDTAQTVLQQALNLTADWTDDFDKQAEALCEIHHGLALIHLRNQSMQAAWEEAQKALHIAQQYQFPLHLGMAHRTAAEVITALLTAGITVDDNPDDHYKAAVSHLRKINAEAEIAKTMFAQATSLIERGRRTSAARLLRQVMEIFQQLGMMNDAAKAADAQLKVL